jgi:hypothetical protein
VLRAFFRPSGDLIILGDGEGMFVNRANPLDVDLDSEVSAGDALAVINYLNAFGAQSLLGGSPSFTSMIDVNLDSHLSAGDALSVINYLNARSHRSVVFSMAGSGGEAEPASSNGDTADSGSDIDAALTTMLQPSTTSTSTSTTTSSTTSNQVNPAAADNLYAGMEAAQQALKKKYKR